MSNIQIHKVMNRLISFLYRIGFWHQGDQPTVGELGMKWFYCIYFFIFFVSLLCGVIFNFSSFKNINQSIFTVTVTVIVGVLQIKLHILIWKQEEVLSLLNRISVYSIRNEETFLVCNEKVERFVKLLVVFSAATFLTASFASFVVPFLGTGKTFIYTFAFPLDWRNDNFAFLIMRRITGQKKVKVSEKELYNVFRRDLRDGIVAHTNLRGLIDEFAALSLNLFFIQFCTSGVCICASTYCLAFDINNNMIERLINVYMFGYNIAELFMITYFGNEIMLSSSSLSYSLFESDWYDQPQSTQKDIIIFGEYLKQAHVLLIGKLFPLTLETFNRILNSAYSMFNILKGLQLMLK